VNDRGIKQVFTPVMWKLLVPPRLHIFLWLLANNKTLIRDNLAKKRKVDDCSCLFCNEDEIVHHLFFGWCVAKMLWSELSEMFDIQIGTDFESVSKLWLCNKKWKMLNI
jgi:hypothetical protein